MRATALRLAQQGAFRSSARASAPSVQPKFQPHVLRFTTESITKWVPTFAVWGGGAAVAATLFLSSVPRYQVDILHKLPFISSYFIDKTPDSDKPF
ncbi:unnamed protein product [Tilletia controversa]|uniref:Uncharacterized protein n=2 Tax=Tilletia TaxID=13289 RepID=A0A177V035_9BASI|nr:hypothetical protein CF336_g2096 [Tilletia laevis]KAE8256620.1 hypothetical protein A4X03_0g5224 [Tilletia caries]CAD6899330.1 unnamed protein product [Tilletia controversa]KAE8207116.1 hypothetical protein CF335_g1384 [Tilletia laevis]CAD6886579.1 unnamed protein product [Tilletia caries]